VDTAWRLPMRGQFATSCMARKRTGGSCRELRVDEKLTERRDEGSARRIDETQQRALTCVFG
jgi:hypothetical protein